MENKKPVLAKKYREPDTSDIPRATRRKIDKYDRSAKARAKVRNINRNKQKLKDERTLVFKKRNDEARARTEKRNKWRRKIGEKIGVSWKRIILTSAISGRTEPNYEVKKSK